MKRLSLAALAGLLDLLVAWAAVSLVVAGLRAGWPAPTVGLHVVMAVLWLAALIRKDSPR